MSTTAPAPARVYRPVAEIARRLEPSRAGKPVHPSTIVRWVTRGVRLQCGALLKLKAKRFPGHWAVSDEDLDDFVERLTADRTNEPGPPSATTSAARAKHDARVARELDHIGI